MIFFAFVLVAAAALFPSDALAWGPAAHLAIGNHILSSLELLPTHVAAALAAHPRAFLYGSLAADILVGKGSRPTPHHSHNWDVARRLLSQATTPRLTAHAYGYLAHLAADVIAHNYFVPNMLGYSAGRGKLAHSYAEMLADAHIRIPRRQGSAIASLMFPEADTLLRQATCQRPATFRLKKGIFQHGVRTLEHLSLAPLARRPRTAALARHSLDLALRLVWTTLADPRHGAAMGHDPIGSGRLFAIRHFHRRQRRFYDLHERGIIFPLAADLAVLESRHETLDRFFAEHRPNHSHP